MSAQFVQVFCVSPVNSCTHCLSLSDYPFMLFYCCLRANNEVETVPFLQWNLHRYGRAYGDRPDESNSGLQVVSVSEQFCRGSHVCHHFAWSHVVLSLRRRDSGRRPGKSENYNAQRAGAPEQFQSTPSDALILARPGGGNSEADRDMVYTFRYKPSGKQLGPPAGCNNFQRFASEISCVQAGNSLAADAQHVGRMPRRPLESIVSLGSHTL